MGESEMTFVGTGNACAAEAVRMCKPDLLLIYPITPQSSLTEKLASFCAKGILDSEIVEVEGENSAMGMAIGGSAAGGRVFTATSSMGLNFMYDTYTMAAGLRLPVVMVNVNREQSPPTGPVAGEQDVMNVRDAGWVHIHCENCQEIFDSILIAFRLAEDPDIQLPVTVSYDGFYLSYLSEGILIPQQEDVDRYLLPTSNETRPILWKHGKPMSFAAVYFDPKGWAEMRFKHQAAFQRVVAKFSQIAEEFEGIFHRRYGGAVEEYRTGGAEIILVSLGSHTGTAKVVVDQKRNEGIKVGLIKLRLFRPFPSENLSKALKGAKAIGVLDRSVCFGWNGGHLFVELKSALFGHLHNIPVIDFIGGLGGADITEKHISEAIDLTHQAARGEIVPEVTWLNLE
jgi:pyruvate/2-oxoacid:ferredoxin oxidoreductase alpha subunit